MNLKTTPLETAPVSVQVRLAFMWVVIMFFYIYNDVFMLLAAVHSGAEHTERRSNETTMLAYALVITPAALMPLLCLLISPAIIRWVNIALGLIYFVIIVFTILPAGTGMFYRFIGITENVVTLVLVWTAWRWPRTALS